MERVIAVPKVNECLYDDSPEPDEFYATHLQPGLSEEEENEAYNLIPFSRGVMLVRGYPGSGKGLFSNMFAWKMKRYFGKRVFLDYLPRRLFGEYTLFDESTFIGELNRLAKVAKGEKDEEITKEIARTDKRRIKEIEKLSESWRTAQGTMLQNSVMVFDEGWRYVHNRRPHNPLGIMIAGLAKIWRHLDLLLLVVAQQRRELDAISFLPYVTHDITCDWSTVKLNTTKAVIHPVKFVSGEGVLNVTGRSIPILVDGNRPRPQLGGKRYFDLFSSKNVVGIKS